MNILVTGAQGRIGAYVVRDLAASGHAVFATDLNTPASQSTAAWLQADLTDAGQVYQLVAWSAPQAVIHLGAWSNSGIVPEAKTYGDNVQGTFNLFQACADMGVKRVINASSGQVYGLAGAPPQYAPMDEEHPLRPLNAYAAAKVASEQAADYFVQKHGMTILSFRFMGVRAPHQIGPEIAAMQADPASGSWLLWTRTDARDAAMACRLAAEAAAVPPGPYNITGAEVVLPTPSRELVSTCFGAQTQLRDGLHGHLSPLSCARAGQAFGYSPRYVWRWNQSHPEEETP
jgi:nucleoside-diphosphate-sugar epimerase